MPLWKLCSKSWCPRVPAASPFCGPRRHRASHSSAVPIPRPAPSQVEGRLVSPMGTQKSLPCPSWRFHGSVQALLEHVRGLNLWPWRWGDSVTKGPSAGPAASFFLQLALTCRRYHQPFDIPAGGPEIGVEAERGRRQCWEEGRAPQVLCLLWFWYLPLSLPLPLHFWQYDRPSAQDENSKVSHSHPGRLCHPERLPVLSSSATWKPNPVSLGLESQ